MFLAIKYVRAGLYHTSLSWQYALFLASGAIQAFANVFESWRPVRLITIEGKSLDIQEVVSCRVRYLIISSLSGMGPIDELWHSPNSFFSKLGRVERSAVFFHGFNECLRITEKSLHISLLECGLYEDLFDALPELTRPVVWDWGTR